MTDNNRAEFGVTIPTTYWFGENWKQFLREDFGEERLVEAEKSLVALFGDSLRGKSFLDIGCGSGLFSLAALRLGASAITSVDVDSVSVECCQQLADQVGAGSELWSIQQGSILDLTFIEQLPRCDIVYSWGVLHHTGDLWRAVENAGRLVAPGGVFLIGIYNWRGGRRGTATWHRLKRWYCRAPKWQRKLWEWVYASWKLLYMALVLRNPVSHVRSYKKYRGMSWYRDITDWLGGYPYEAATPGEVLEFVRTRLGLQLTKQRINQELGISEFLFKAS